MNIVDCETRFIQSHDDILRFAENFQGVVGALQFIAESPTMDAKTKAKALSLINSASTSSFLVSLAAAKKVMSLTVLLSRHLQSPKIDLLDGTGMINHVNKHLNEWRARPKIPFYVSQRTSCYTGEG